MVMLPSRLLLMAIICMFSVFASVPALYLSQYLRSKLLLKSILRLHHDKHTTLLKRVMLNRDHLVKRKEYWESERLPPSSVRNRTYNDVQPAVNVTLHSFTVLAQQLLNKGIQFRQLVEAIINTSSSPPEVSPSTTPSTADEQVIYNVLHILFGIIYT